MDKFPEAFARFKRVVNVEDIESFGELKLAFALFAGDKWKDSSAQNRALSNEGERLGIRVERFSGFYASFSVWREKRVRSSVYERRIKNYMKYHPYASLREARGHGR